MGDEADSCALLLSKSLGEISVWEGLRGRMTHTNTSVHFAAGDKRTSSPHSLFQPLRPSEVCSGYFLALSLLIAHLVYPLILLQGPLQLPRVLCFSALPCLPLLLLTPWCLFCTLGTCYTRLLSLGSMSIRSGVWCGLGTEVCKLQNGGQGTCLIYLCHCKHPTRCPHITGLQACTLQITACHWLIT